MILWIAERFIAMLQWQPDCVEELVRLGADLKLRNQHYLTALDMAGHFDGKTNVKARTSVRKQVTANTTWTICHAQAHFGTRDQHCSLGLSVTKGVVCGTDPHPGPSAEDADSIPR